MKQVILAFLIFINLLEFILSAMDKRAAIRGNRRVPEKTLWMFAFLGGAMGLCLSMWIFRHKTRHISFVLGAPLLVVIQAVLAYLAL